MGPAGHSGHGVGESILFQRSCRSFPPGHCCWVRGSSHLVPGLQTHQARLLLPRSLMQLSAPTVTRPPGVESPSFRAICRPVLTHRVSKPTYLQLWVRLGWPLLGHGAWPGQLASKAKEAGESF